MANGKALIFYGLLGAALAACLPSKQCLQTHYVYSGTRTGVLWSKTLDEKGVIVSAGGSNLAETLAQDGGPAQYCWVSSLSLTGGQVTAWIDVTGAEEPNCESNPSGILCAPRLCDPRGSAPFQISGALTTTTVVLTDPDAGCP